MSKSGFIHDRSPDFSTEEWYTPPELFEALGINFDLDPAAPEGGVPWIPAGRHYSKLDDGLTQPWVGRVWLNPPYGREVGKWLARLVEHGDGLALVFARTDTRWFHKYVPKATAVCFVAGRLRFVRPDGKPADSAGAPSLLIAYGLASAIALTESGLGQTFSIPHSPAPGKFRQNGGWSLEVFKNLNHSEDRGSKR